MTAPTSSWQQFLTDVVYPGIWGLLSAALVFLGRQAYEALRKYIATTKHGQKIGIMVEAIEKAVVTKANQKGQHYKELIAELKAIFSDFKVTPEEKERLKAVRKEILDDAEDIAREQFKHLRGFVVDEGTDRIREQLDALLGELESRVFGSDMS
jgi:cysteinyl-tRNA synthetase